MRRSPRCPECRWFLSFEEFGASWEARCWNPNCATEEVHAGGLRDPVTRLADLREQAYGWGWSLALHGSNLRDLDLVAVPWSSHAVSHPSLVQMLARRLSATIETTQWKPHGRVGYLLTPRTQPSPGGFRSVDLSVVDARWALEKAAA